MNKVKINAFQLFVLVFLFEMGSSILVGLGSHARQDAWIAMLLGMAGGLVLFLIYHRLFSYYPDLLLTSYAQKITGKWVGRIIGFLYIIYFIYIAARVLRAFGELLTSTIYTLTPQFVVITLMILTILYAIYKGIEVLARLGELLFFLVYFMAIAGGLLMVFSGLIQLDNLKPILEYGIMPVLKVSLTQTINFPFGEMVVFTMILPCLNEPKKAKKICLLAMFLSGLNITITFIIDIATLGVDLFIRSPFPLLTAIEKIQLLNFIERLDVLFMLYLTIGSFMKIAIYYYVAVVGTADLFKFSKPSKIIFPIGLLILFASGAISSNYSEDIKEGLEVVPIYLHWPFQIIIPGWLLIVAIFKNKGKNSQVEKNL
ncbi:GerAB/ArcD/ProY family transporter [Bacillus sp. EB600]|uniref:GerAB/ArcD/ProY family transporter n=1 Tax=Bacillus sp. EB600 TaxID=2806345 RepID=UPI00210A3D4C|nr:GerAB/ArcD/ProY family transporter [Bacillus sp. EB600]MCQ6279224.1 GerAB/ArcD/ProY family transporter [Bacillus sp. EB600]